MSRLTDFSRRLIVVTAATAGLAGCLGYNSPLAPPAKESWSASCAGILGHWIGNLDRKDKDSIHLTVGEGGPKHEAVLYLSDVQGKGEWMMGFAHPTTIGGRTYMNFHGFDLKESEDVLKYDSEWMVLTCDTKNEGRELSLHLLDSKKQEFFAQAGIATRDPDKLGETLAEYLRRFGPYALMPKEDFHFHRAKIVPTEGKADRP